MPMADPNALTVDLAYSLNGGGSWVPIAAARPNTGSYNWTLPTPGGGQCPGAGHGFRRGGHGHRHQ